MVLMNLEIFAITKLKSQLAGFFAFLLLSACQPERSPEQLLMQQAQTDANAAVQLATKRLASNEHDAALHWFQHAAGLGHNGALAHALQLQQRQQGKLATARWLQNSLKDGVLASSQISDKHRAELGLWAEADNVTVKGYQSPEGCMLTIQPVVSQQAGVGQWQQLLQQWQQDAALTSLPVCFTPLYVVNSVKLACTEQVTQRIECQYDSLNDLVAQNRFSQLLVIAGRGIASYNNGIIQLPENSSLALLKHEFMHVLGFIDEYQLPAVVAAEVCQLDRLHPNIIIADKVDAYLQYWQLPANDIELTPVDTCKRLNVTAYRVIAERNVMRSYQAQLPALYLQLAQRILAKPEAIMPVQYYFAYLARQQQNWPQWQHFMQQAAAWGYADAQQALQL